MIPFFKKYRYAVDADGITFYRNTPPPPSSIAFVEGLILETYFVTLASATETGHTPASHNARMSYSVPCYS